jgi:hypothetical protein
MKQIYLKKVLLLCLLVILGTNTYAQQWSVGARIGWQPNNPIYTGDKELTNDRNPMLS